MDSPIFVAGTPRSGTTLLQQIIGSHSEVAVPDETHYFNCYWRRGGRDRALRDKVRSRAHIERVLAGPEIGAMDFTDTEMHSLWYRAAMEL